MKYTIKANTAKVPIKTDISEEEACDFLRVTPDTLHEKVRNKEFIRGKWKVTTDEALPPKQKNYVQGFTEEEWKAFCTAWFNACDRIRKGKRARR